MKRFIYITIFVFTLLVGIVSTQIVEIVDMWTGQVNNSQIQSNNVPEIVYPKIVYPRFRLLEKGFNDYQFQSSNRERRFANGANISILHDFVSPEGMHEILEANCTKYRRDSIKRSFKLDENGQRIGERCVIVNRSSGETRIIWTESKTEYWTIDATSLSLAKEFESSETFRLLKSSQYSKRE